jgi:hypothetical protein
MCILVGLTEKSISQSLVANPSTVRIPPLAKRSVLVRPWVPDREYGHIQQQETVYMVRQTQITMQDYPVYSLIRIPADVLLVFTLKVEELNIVPSIEDVIS